MKKKLFFFALSLASAYLFAGQEISSSDKDKAKEMAETVNEQLGTAPSITNNAIVPLTSTKKLKTYDGKKEFDFHLTCNSAVPFADFTIAPVSNGNIKVLNVRQDTNMDGTIDTVQTPNWQASAICANGYMYCSNPNDPTSCKSYQWDARASDFLLSPKQVPMTSLGGCYCINNACGNNLAMNNLETIMGDLANGMAAALGDKNKFFAMTNLAIDGTYAQMQGVSSKTCNPANADSVLGTEDVSKITDTDYINNPGKLKDDGFAAQSDSPLYDQLSKSAEDVGFEYRSCNITRQVSEDKVQNKDIVSFDSGTGDLYEIQEGILRIILGKVGDDYWSGNCTYNELTSTFFIKRPDRIKSAKIIRAKFDDWIQVHVVQDGNFTHVWNGPYGTWTNPTANVPGKCELSTSWDMGDIGLDFASAFAKEGQVTFRIRVEVSGDGEGFILGELQLDTSCKVNPDQYADTCEQYYKNNKCTLVEETVDGVKTFSNGFSTGLYPLPKIAANLCGIDQEREWMKKERKYRCENGYEYNFDDAFDRIAYVKDNSNLDTWGDKTDSGAANGNFTMIDGLDPMQCSMTCKTRKEKTVTDMTLTGTTGSKQTTPQSYDFFYHECTGANYDVCPSGDGEEVIKQCQCLNEFSEATAIMQSLRLAGEDMICTDGEKKMPDGEDKQE